MAHFLRRESAVTISAPTAWIQTGVPAIVADPADRASIDAFVRRTRIVLSTAGPFELYSDPVVDACVRFGSHYVDITGETLWVRSLIDRYHERAAADGTRVIPFCGFDSVPSDLGATWVAQQLGGSFGIAIIAVVLQTHVAHATSAADAAHAFHVTFWWAVGSALLALVVAPLLPGKAMVLAAATGEPS